jgi:WD40 repeat protein
LRPPAPTHHPHPKKGRPVPFSISGAKGALPVLSPQHSTRRSHAVRVCGEMATDLVQYSEPHLQTEGLVKFSPCGSYIASAAGYRLILRDVDTLQIVQLYSCIDAIEGLEWSCDSEYVLCTIQKRGAAQVWSVINKEWHCKIDEGPVGLAHARWSPDGRHVLATADFRLRITIWSLCDRSVFYIRFPKHADKGLDFTSDGSLMALAERTDGKDSVGIFDPKGWSPVRTFGVASQDLEDLKWAPNRDVLCVIDTVLQYQVLLYTASGEHLQTYRPYENAGVVRRARASAQLAHVAADRRVLPPHQRAPLVLRGSRGVGRAPRRLDRGLRRAATAADGARAATKPRQGPPQGGRRAALVVARRSLPRHA